MLSFISLTAAIKVILRHLWVDWKRFFYRYGTIFNYQSRRRV